MKPQPRVKPYYWLARYYDRMFEPYRGPAREMRERALGAAAKRIRTACDLACGTGTTAIELARAGAYVYAVDLSPGMCRLAREKSRRHAAGVHVIRADMRDFELPQPVDLVTCEYDALNHLPAKRDLATVLRCVARALRPGGRFLFDVNNRLGFKRYWNKTVWEERPGVVLVMRNGEDHQNDRAWSDVEWFVKEGGLWRRHRERVEEVCWSAAEMRAALAAAGFGAVRTWDEARMFGPESFVTRGCRTLWLARRRL